MYVRTRISVWVLAQYRQLGASDGDLLRAYPVLRATNLANAWAYVRAHRDEVLQQIRANEAARTWPGCLRTKISRGRLSETAGMRA